MRINKKIISFTIYYSLLLILRPRSLALSVQHVLRKLVFNLTQKAVLKRRRRIFMNPRAATV
jgi:hypothetical protein